MLPTISNRLGEEPRELPFEYTRLNYLESTGTQYIDTGIHLNNDSTVDCTFSVTDVFNYQMPYGIDYRNRFGFYTYYNNTYFAFAYGEIVAEPSPRILVKKGEKYNVKQEGQYNYLNGELVLTQARADFKSNHHCFLFLPVADVDSLPGKRKSKL